MILHISGQLHVRMCVQLFAQLASMLGNSTQARISRFCISIKTYLAAAIDHSTPHHSSCNICSIDRTVPTYSLATSANVIFLIILATIFDHAKGGATHLIRTGIALNDKGDLCTYCKGKKKQSWQNIFSYLGIRMYRYTAVVHNAGFETRIVRIRSTKMFKPCGQYGDLKELQTNRCFIPMEILAILEYLLEFYLFGQKTGGGRIWIPTKL